MGSLLGILLFVQILRGVLLALYYTPDSSLAFERVQYICREVRRGWLVRLIHFNGASIIFLCLYAHIVKAFLLRRYRLRSVWFRGFLLFFLMIAIAFTGYTLSWSQMSYWAAVVITSLIRTIPFFGDSLLLWIWGGYRVGNATLKLFFVLHFLLPWFLLIVVVYHLLSLHSVGSTSNLGYRGGLGKVTFFPFYWAQDSVNFLFLFLAYLFILEFPYYLGDPEMFVEANPMMSPLHIVPEWYFLAYYAILRAIPNKSIGVAVLLLRLLVPMMFGLIRNYMSPLVLFLRSLVYCFVSVFVLLSWLGQRPLEHPYVMLRGVLTLFYFIVLILMARVYLVT